jgi:hypothetical protein
MRIALVVSALAALVAPAVGQSLYTVDGPGGVFDEITGPPDPALCNYPNGPVISSFPFNVGAPCITPATFAPPPGSLLGDIAVDTVKDEVYVTDGNVIGVYKASNGAWLNSMPAFPLQGLTGLGFDSVAGILWMTDGTLISGVVPSPPGSCAPGGPVTPVFPSPFGMGILTDVAWQSGLNLLFVCDSNGLVAAMTAVGAPAVAPWLAGKFCPGITPPLTGIAFDDGGAGSLTGATQLYITDGFTIGLEPVMGIGIPAPSFYTTAVCTNVPGPPTQGLAFAARPITYGQGTDPSGLTPPTIGAAGQSVTPNPGFALTLAGSVPNSSAYLVVGTAAACPKLTFKLNDWYVNPFLVTFGPFNVDAAGAVFVPAPLGPPGPAWPPSLSSYLQWMVKKPDGTWQATEGLELTLCFP